MAFAPKTSKGPRRSPYHQTSLPASSSSSKARMALSFDAVQPASATDDATSVQGSSGSDPRTSSRLRPPGTAWTSEKTGESELQRHNSSSFTQPEGLVTPGPKEGPKLGFKTDHRQSNQQEHSATASDTVLVGKTVNLSPDACKCLNAVAAQLWIIAHHQKYQSKHAKASADGDENLQQLTQAAVMHVLKTTKTSSTEPRYEGRQCSLLPWSVMTVALLTALVLAGVCLAHLMRSNSSQDADFS